MGLRISDYKSGHLLARVDRSDCSTSKSTLKVCDNKIVLLPENTEYKLDDKQADSFSAFLDGDIVEITNNGVCFKRFDSSEYDATIYLGGQCNSNCVMCPCFDGERQEPCEDDWYISTFIDLLPDNLPHFVVTGGEPTLNLKAFFSAMDKLAEKLPKAEGLLLTNGRSFSYNKVIERLLDKCPPYLTVAIPLHGSNAMIHDRITRAEGSFQQTLKGIENLLKRYVAVEIRIVVNRYNQYDVDAIAEMICKEFPSVLCVNFISLEARGNCYVNMKDVFITAEESFKASKSAIRRLLSSGINVGLYNYPLCSVDPGYWFLCKKSISPSKIRYAEECTECLVKDKCGGMFVTTMKAAHPRVYPVLDREDIS